MRTIAPASVLAGRSPDAVYLYAARAARGFGDGFAFIILPVYLSELGFTPFQIGLVATAALLGSAATTLAVGFLAARYDLRNLLLVGAMVMALTGLAVVSSHALAWILVVVFMGSLNPRPEIWGCSCRSSTPCWRAARATRSAPACSPAIV